MFTQSLSRIGLYALTTAVPVALVAAAPAAAKTLKWASQGDLNSADQYMRNQTLSLSIMSNVYEGLIRRNPATLAIEPNLAEKWEIVEPTRWRFHLRKGVKFHDGKPFTADDVVFSADRARSKGSDIKGRLPGVKEVKKVDDYTVDFVTEKPNPILHVEWATWGMYSKGWSIDNKSTEVVDPTKGEAPNFATTNANGTGPFKLKSREADVKTVFEANPDWWGKKNFPNSNVTEVIFTPIKSAPTRVAALLSGEIDFMEPVPVQDIDRINNNKGTRVISSPETRVVYFGFDHHRDELLYSSVKGKNPFKDKRVRQAFLHAIDIEAIKTKVMRNMAAPSAMMIGKGIHGWSADFKRLPYDPNKAKQLLAEAGYPNGFEVQLDCPNDRYVNDEPICQATVGMLQRIGVKVNLVTKSNTVLFGEYQKMETSFFMLGWAPGSYDSWNPMQFLHRTVPTGPDGKSIPSCCNYGRYSNKAFDALVDKIGQETDQKKRDELIKQAWTISIDDVAYIPLHQQAIAWAARDSVAKLEPHAGNEFLWWYVQMK
ncbi:MAG: ABC transporter substrate-binding protein [Alphaproteobacteria bacterium]|nr:ABC transporter substrate-binding protein [Alphaproteobacteria bacterium]